MSIHYKQLLVIIAGTVLGGLALTHLRKTYPQFEE